MKTRRTSRRPRATGEDIDRIVVAQADDDSAWDSPIRVSRAKTGKISIPPDLAARASFLAQVHRAAGLEEWLTRVIRERIELEEVAFAQAKREHAAKPAS